jgi:hypothetical protein
MLSEQPVIQSACLAIVGSERCEQTFLLYDWFSYGCSATLCAYDLELATVTHLPVLHAVRTYLNTAHTAIYQQHIYAVQPALRIQLAPFAASGATKIGVLARSAIPASAAAQRE